MNDIGIVIDEFGVALRVPVSRDVLDEMDAREFCGEHEGRNCWAKVIREMNVAVVFVTYEPPRST